MAIKVPFEKVAAPEDNPFSHVGNHATKTIDHQLGEAYNVVEFVRLHLSEIQDAAAILDPDRFAPAVHEHDDRYSRLSHDHHGTYAVIGHNHDSRYSLLSHNHDGRYSLSDHHHDTVYSKLDHHHDGRYSQLTHHHDSRYSLLTHNHDGRYALLGHNHDTRYAPLTHEHEGQYSEVTHNHDGRYALLNHNHDGRYALLAHHHDTRYSLLAHNHDGRYSLLSHHHDARYALKSHNHDDRYYTKVISDLRYLAADADLSGVYIPRGTPLGDAFDPADLTNTITERLQGRIAQLDQTTAELAAAALTITAQGEEMIALALSRDRIDGALTSLTADHADLATFVNQVNDLRTGNVASLTTLIATERSQRINGDTALAALVSIIGARSADGLSFVLDLTKVKVSPTESLANRFSSITSEQGQTYAQIEEERQTRATDIAAEAFSRELMGATIRGEVSAAFSDERTVRVTEFEAEAAARELLAVTLRGELTAAIFSERTARVSGDEAEATARNGLAATLRDEVTAHITNEAAARVAGDNAEATTREQLAVTLRGEISGHITTEQTARIEQDNVFLNTFTLLGAKNEGGSAFILNESTVKLGDGVALGTRLSGIDSRITTVDADIRSTISEESIARSDAEGALGVRIGAVEASYQTASDVDNRATTIVNAKVSEEATARANADGALSTKIDTVVASQGGKTYRQPNPPPLGNGGELWFDTDDNNKPYRSNGSVWEPVDDERITATQALVSDESSARVTADSALAGRISTVEASYQSASQVDARATTIADAKVSAEATARADADGALSTRIDSVVASSGGKTYHQANPPPVGNGGELWFDSDDNNRPYRSNGSGWALVDDARISSNSAAITNEATARSNADVALSGRISTVEANYQTADQVDTRATTIANAKVADEATARTNADSALSTRISTVESNYQTAAQVDTRATNVATTIANSKVADEATARTNADNALSGRISTVESNYQTAAQVDSRATTIANAKVAEEATTRANADTAISGRVSTVESNYQNSTQVNSIATTVANAKVAEEATARTNADGALSTRIDTVVSTVNGHDARITTAQSAAATVDGRVNAIHSLSVNAGGKIAGYVAQSNGSVSNFDILATTFRVSDGTTTLAPFTVTGGNVFINGSLTISNGNGQTLAQTQASAAGGSPVNMVNVTGTTVAKNSVTGSGGWTVAYGREMIRGASSMSFRTNGTCIVGLRQTIPSAGGDSAVGLTLYFYDTSNWYFYGESGDFTTGTLSGTYNSLDVFTLTYDNRRIWVYKNGVLCGSRQFFAADRLHYAIASPLGGTTISDILFTPSTDNSLRNTAWAHATDTTKIDGGNIYTNSITADKILLGSTSGARLQLDSNLLRVFDSSGVLRVRLGIW